MIPRPFTIAKYNKHMGEQFKWIKILHAIGINRKKWSLFTWLLGILGNNEL